MTPQSVERPISMTDDELIGLLNEIVRREEQLGKPIAMPKPRLETIAKAATRIEQLRKALEFYRDQWETDVDAEQTVHGWTGTIGDTIPTETLYLDRGDTARAALIQSGER